MVPSSLVLWLITAASLAAGVAVLLVWKQRQERAVKDFSTQIRYLLSGNAPGRVTLEPKPGALGQLGSAVNKLLEDLEQRGARLQDREQLFQRLVETVHDAVLVHREVVLFANARFLSLLGLNAADVVGRSLTEFVAPEYVELVASNLKRRLGGEPAAERYEADRKSVV